MKHYTVRPHVKLLLLLTSFSLLVSACSQSGAGYFIPPGETPTSPPVPDLLATLAPSAIPPTPQPPTDPTPESIPEPPIAGSSPGVSAPADQNGPIIYTAQAADTLPVVAVRFGVDPSEIHSPDPIPETGFINPGQLLLIPRRLGNTTSSERLMPDSEVVFSPSAADFDARAFIEQAGGRLSTYRSWLKSTGITSGADIIMRVATENSINPRLLISLLEYQSHWVYGQPQNAREERYPMGLNDPNRDNLYEQLVYAVNQLSIGYYAYREGRMTEINFPDGTVARLSPELNAGTAALQYYFAQLYQGQDWLNALDPANGFPALHERMFGNPWERAMQVEPLFPSGLVQPPLTLPFTRNWQWSFTGGPHGAWEHDGAYAALDFAPGSTESGCVKSNAWVVASASGLVVRSGGGVVVLDLDGDGREQTGWVLIYLHVSSEQRIPVGEWADAGDPLGHPSCEGGMSTGTHVHIARKYNGEWVPADGPLPFDLGGWVAQAGETAYKGTLTRGDQVVTACTCSSAATFIVRTDTDP